MQFIYPLMAICNKKNYDTSKTTTQECIHLINTRNKNKRTKGRCNQKHTNTPFWEIYYSTDISVNILLLIIYALIIYIEIKSKQIGTKERYNQRHTNTRSWKCDFRPLRTLKTPQMLVMSYYYYCHRTDAFSAAIPLFLNIFSEGDGSLSALCLCGHGSRCVCVCVGGISGPSISCSRGLTFAASKQAWGKGKGKGSESEWVLDGSLQQLSPFPPATNQRSSKPKQTCLPVCNQQRREKSLSHSPSLPRGEN